MELNGATPENGSDMRIACKTALPAEQKNPIKRLSYEDHKTAATASAACTSRIAGTPRVNERCLVLWR